MIDKDLNKYIDSIEKRIKDFEDVVQKGQVSSGSDYLQWYNKVNEKVTIIFKLRNEFPKKFEKCLDLKKI